MEWIQVFVVVFFAIFTQSLAGFGVALVSMPLLTALLGIQTAAPLVALIALVAEIILLIYYRSALNLRVVWQLALASVIGVPVGVLALRTVNEQLVLMLLGLIIASYAIYALMNLRLPDVQRAGWAYGTGFIAGILGGAYNTAGPPVIVYGNCRQWPPAEFKSNLQGFFVLNSTAILVTHIVARNYSPLVWRHILVALPATALGIWLGLNLSGRIDARTFRKIILWLLLALGLWLIIFV